MVFSVIYAAIDPISRIVGFPEEIELVIENTGVRCLRGFIEIIDPVSCGPANTIRRAAVVDSVARVVGFPEKVQLVVRHAGC